MAFLGKGISHKGISRYLKCVRFRSQCRGTAIIINGILTHSMPHNHQASLAEVQLGDPYSDNAMVSDMYQYVERYWITLVGVERISVYKAPRRTNAAVESHNNILKNGFGTVHPKFWKFVERMKTIINTNEKEIIHLRSGAKIRRSAGNKQKVTENRIKDAEDCYDKGTLSAIEFLQRSNYNIKFTEMDRSFDLKGDDHEIRSHDSLPTTRQEIYNPRPDNTSTPSVSQPPAVNNSVSTTNRSIYQLPAVHNSLLRAVNDHDVSTDAAADDSSCGDEFPVMETLIV